MPGKKKNKPLWRAIIGVLLKFLVAVFGLLVIITLLLNIPAVQTYLTSRVSNYLEKKLETTARIEGVKIALPKTIVLQGLYFEDQNKDTLLYLGNLEIDVALFGLLHNNVNANNIYIESLVSHVHRRAPTNDFNFQFIIDAFAPSDTIPAQTTEPEQEAKPWDLSVGEVHLEQINLSYFDDVVGIDARLQLGELIIDVDELDPVEMVFMLDDLAMKNTRASVEMWEVAMAVDEAELPASTDTSTTAYLLPEVGLKNLLIENVNLTYKYRDWQYDFVADIGNLEVETESIDLNAQVVKLNSFQFTNSVLLAAMPLSSGGADTLITADSTALQNPSFPQEIPNPFPDWDISVNEIDLEKVNAVLDDINSVASAGAIDFINLNVENLSLVVKDASISSTGAKAKIDKLSFKEQSGFSLTNLSCKVSASDKSAAINALKVETPNSNLNIDASVKMASINSLLTDPSTTHLVLDMQKSNIGIKDIKMVMPSLAENEYMSMVGELNPTVKINASGTLQELQLRSAGLQLTKNTGLRLSGSFKNIMDFDKLSFDLFLDTLYSSKNDLYKLLDSATFQGYNIPDKIGLKASANGTPDSLTARLNGQTSMGDFIAEAYFYKPANSPRDTFNLNLDLKDFNLDGYIADTTLGLVNLNLEATGSGALTDSISANLKANILHPEINKYTYEDLLLTASMRNMNFDAQLESTDPNASFNLDANADLSREKFHLELGLDVALLNLYTLNFSTDKVALKTQLNASVDYLNLDDLDAEVSFSNIEIYQDKEVLAFSSASIETQLTPDSTFLNIKSEPLSLNLESNISSIELEPVLRSATLKYLGLNDTIGLPAGKNLTFDVTFSRDDKMKMPLFPEIKELKVDKFSGSYNSDDNLLAINLDVPKFVYNNIILDSIKVAVNGLEQNSSFQAGFAQMSIDSVKVDPFLAMAKINNGEVFSELRFGQDLDSLSFLISSQLEIEDEALKISLLPDGLIFDHQKWKVPEGNFLKITNDNFFSENFNFNFEDQYLGVEINNQLADLNFDNFDVGNLVCFLFVEKYRAVADGTLKGKMSLPGKANNEHFMADLRFEQLHVFDTLVGNLNIQADHSGGLLQMDIDFDNPLNKMSLSGNIDQNTEKYDLKGLIAFSDISLLERFTFGEVSQMTGVIDGDFSLKGTYDDPDLEGSLNFKNAHLNITKLNFRTTLIDESLRVDKKGIHFDNFTITDAQNEKLNVDGSLLTKDFSDIAFDLHVHADRFQPVNSTNKDNPRFYGSLVIGTDIKINGDMDLPRIEANLEIQKGTNLTYVMPGSEIELITPGGTVNFINPNLRPDTLFAQQTGSYLSDSIMSKFQGIDLSANLELDPEAKFTVFIDPTSGDYLTIGGKANLNFSADQSGSQTVTGVFEVSEGLYQLSFYGLVKKSFTIKPGGTVAWSGRPMDANLNITAMYIVRTASTALVANESGSLSQAELNMFKTRLPYEVLLNINGFMDEPKVSFNINLEEKYMVNYPMVASKLARLNTPEMQSELNKQVFALLVAGTFIADNPLSSTSSSTDNIATTAARNSVNGILADQLNNISNQYVKFIDLNFGLTTFDDYSSGSSETRTELDVTVSKKFMNDRLEVEATGTFGLEGDSKNYNGATSQNMYGEFSVIYDLNESREYKIKAFRENAYDIFDGDVAYSGLALIFEKSFNSLKKLRKERKKKKGKSNNEGTKEEGLEPDNE